MYGEIECWNCLVGMWSPEGRVDQTHNSPCMVRSLRHAQKALPSLRGTAKDLKEGRIPCSAGFLTGKDIKQPGVGNHVTPGEKMGLFDQLPFAEEATATNSLPLKRQKQ